jgi:putative intracellular protease/amidase
MEVLNTPGMKREALPRTILMPLPDRDFDPTEVSIPWKVLTSRGWNVEFSTEQGNIAQADHNLLRGPILGPLGAGGKARAAYRQMVQNPSYRQPIPYIEIDPDRYQAILLPGGHSAGMRHYVESKVLQEKVLHFWQQGKLIAAICHGILLLSRTIDPRTGRSILFGHKITALPKSIDRLAYLLNTRLMRRPYLMYSCSVEEEVRACLEFPEDFCIGPGLLDPYVVCDGNLITARYPVDAELFSERIGWGLSCESNQKKYPMRQAAHNR